METKCRKCKNELGLCDEDAGSEKEVSRICEKCQGIKNTCAFKGCEKQVSINSKIYCIDHAYEHKMNGY